MPIKIFNFNGKKIKEINDSNENTFFIDSFYDYKTSQNYIITSHKNYVKYYNYNDNKLYKKYYENNNYFHKTVFITSNKGIVKLIESCEDRNIRIWNFHSDLLLKRIRVNQSIKDFCLWNYNSIFVRAKLFSEKINYKEKTIKLADLKNGKIILSSGHKEIIVEIKKIIHPILGICLIKRGSVDNQIRLWLIKN